MTTSVLAPSGAPQADLPQQAGMLLQQLAGYVGIRTLQMGLEAGLVTALAARDDGLTADELAVETDIDPFYAGVWCRAAVGAGILHRSGDRLRLGDHLRELLLVGDHPAHVGATIRILGQPEMFDRFGERLASGERTWWDRCSPEFIAAVAATGTPFYVRLVPGGLQRVPGLAERLQEPVRILDTACGSGVGLRRLAEAYPRATLVGADGDPHSVQSAARLLAEAGVADRVELVCTPLEELDRTDEFDLVLNNISMHECRDIDEVTGRIRRALRPGGWFVISDFPFPDSDEGLRSVPGRVMSAIQFFEAQIDDQLVPPSAYLDLLGRHGFTEVASQPLTPVHALTHGRRPTA